MRLLRAYVLREHLGPFAVTLGGLTAALLIGHIVKFAELVISKGVGLFDILRLLIYLVPSLLSFTIPMACLIAMVMAFGRLNTDYELIAMRASGVSPGRLILPFLTAAVVASGFLLGVNDRVVPGTHLAFRRQLKAIGVKRPTAYIEAGTFIKEFEPYVIFVYQVEGKTMLHVRIYEPKADGSTRTIVASRGEFEPMRDGRAMLLKLYQGTVDEWDPERPGSLYKVSFGTYSMQLLSDAEGAGRVNKKLKEMTFSELMEESRHLTARRINVLPIELELHRRLASSCAPVVFILFGLIFGLGRHHHERLITFVWIIVLFLVYYLATLGMNALALKGWLPPWLAMWLPNVVGLAVGVVGLSRTIRR